MFTIKRSLEAQIRWLDQEMAGIEATLQPQKSIAERQSAQALLTAVPGVRDFTA